jgi:hypothetical protein
MTDAEARAMTKLLATRKSTEALAYARRLIERGHRTDEFGSSVFDPARSREFVRSVISVMMLTAEGRLSLIELARIGEEDAQIILKTAILEFKSRGERLPTELEAYNMELVAGRVPLPVGVDGPDRRDRLLRDISISTTVAAVCDRFGLKMFGRSARTRSGCSVVGEALGVIGKRMSTATVETICKRYRQGMPTVPGWSFRLDDQ